MAITIQHNPGTYFSVHGDVIFTVVDIVKASDPVTYPDYRYIADVYVGAILVTRLKAYPQPDNKIGVFNIGNILRSYISAVFEPTAAAISAQVMGSTKFYIEATVKFGEEYNFTMYTNLTVDSERMYFNHYNGRLIGQLTNLADYPEKLASARPLATPLKEDSVFNLLPVLQPASLVTYEIKSYTKSGTLIGTYAAFSASGSVDTMKMFNMSPAVINAVSPDLINPAIASYFTVEFQGNDIIYRFNLTCEAKHEVFTIHFLNRFGGFESRDFTKVSRKTIDIEKSEFGKLGYTMDSSGVVTYANAQNVYNETRSIYSSQYKEKMVLNTDILSDEEYLWLGDLVLSPLVYIEMRPEATSYFLPCVIVSSNYEFRKSRNDSLTNLTVNIEFGEQFNAQYR